MGSEMCIRDSLRQYIYVLTRVFDVPHVSSIVTFDTVTFCPVLQGKGLVEDRCLTTDKLDGCLWVMSCFDQVTTMLRTAC